MRAIDVKKIIIRVLTFCFIFSSCCLAGAHLLRDLHVQLRALVEQRRRGRPRHGREAAERLRGVVHRVERREHLEEGSRK